MRGWSNMDILVDGLNLNKGDKKRLEKINKINIHLQALFAAVEHGQVEKAKNILQDNTFDINCLNQEGLSVLEVAVMTGNSYLVQVLQRAGAKETTNSGSVEHRLDHLDDLVVLAERRKDELSSCLIPTKETERQHAHWDKKSKNLHKMRQGLRSLSVPEVPASATLEVIDATRVKLTFQEPIQHSATVTTKFKVEWSHDEWKTVSGSLEFYDLRETSTIVENLPHGIKVYFRVSAGNMKGFSLPKETSPAYSVPSSWRDIDDKKPRLDGIHGELENLFNQVIDSRPESASEIKTLHNKQKTPNLQRKIQKKKSLMQLFSQSPKFQKNLKRGSYLACIIYCQDKVLVTNEDFPPVVEIDDSYLSQVKLHFSWLMKVASTWEDVKILQQDMEQVGSSSQLPYRIKLLQAVAIMQSSLGIQDLGEIYHKPIKDNAGTYVFCCVKNVKTTKSISAMNIRWAQISKLTERKSTSGDEGQPSVNDLFISSLQEQITYNQTSKLSLSKGLHIGYLKLHSSFDQLQVIVPEKIPNMFPHIRIRDNPHVSREEWEWIQNLSESCIGKSEAKPQSATQREWQDKLIDSCKLLLQRLGTPEDTWDQHRIYSREVLDLNSEVSLILLLPPIDSVCCSPGQEDSVLSNPDLIALSLNVYEMIHLGTYQKSIMNLYCRLSYILEMDMLIAQQASREAFNAREFSLSKNRLDQLTEFQLQREVIWKSCRWVTDAINFAREKTIQGVFLKNLIAYKNWVNLPRKALPNLVQSHELTQHEQEFANLNSENKRFRKDGQRDSPTNGYLVNESETLYNKSNTGDNYVSNDSSKHDLSKQFTSEYVVYSTSCHFDVNMTHGEFSSGSIPVLTSKGETEDLKTPLEQIHVNNVSTKRGRLIADHPKEEFALQRKSSAPPFFEGSKLYIQDPFNKFGQSASLNSLDNSSECLDYKKESSTELSSESTSLEWPVSNASSSNLNEKFSCQIKRAVSSISCESDRSYLSITTSMNSECSNDTEPDAISSMSKESAKSEDAEGSKNPEETAIIRVYAAYETGLAAGTSVKLQITTRTTAREIIDLVVKQLNMTVILKKKTNPIYGSDKLRDFCLVAVIGTRERCLRDDFRILHLQNPWKTGCLYIRLKQDILAAIEQSNTRHSSYL